MRRWRKPGAVAVVVAVVVGGGLKKGSEREKVENKTTGRDNTGSVHHEIALTHHHLPLRTTTTTHIHTLTVSHSHTLKLSPHKTRGMDTGGNLEGG